MAWYAIGSNSNDAPAQVQTVLNRLLWLMTSNVMECFNTGITPLSLNYIKYLYYRNSSDRLF